MQLEILFEDNHLLVVNKPKGLLTQPSGTDAQNLEDFAKEYLKKTKNKPGQVFLHAIHRLDTPASGIVAFAKTSKALSRMNTFLREGKFSKWYEAEVEGSVVASEGRLENQLVHEDHKARVVLTGGKQAALSYRVLSRGKATTLLEIELHTGRYHQIRAQLSHAGYPIVGDTKYGARLPSKTGGIALHHSRLIAPHPISQELMRWESSSTAL